ncbi:MAG: DUF1489 domain-containing protein [Kiloniellales bacterium]
MTQHLIKLSVGSESVETLARWQAERRKRLGRVFHMTRMMPRRRAELLAGGSIYWVIRGRVRARQRLIGIERGANEAGEPRTLLFLDRKLVRTLPWPHRPFQGWRYLLPEDAPPDLDDLPAGARDLPPDMAAELLELGLL